MKALTVDTKTEMILRLRLAAKDWNIAELSRRTGIQRAHLYKTLSEEGNPTLENLVKIAKALNLDIQLISKDPA